MSDLFRQILSHVTCHEHLSQEQSHEVFTELMEGKLSEVQIAGLLMAMATKGPDVAEIAGAAQAMREHAVKINADRLDVVDTCGTGGTGLSTFNISTAAALVAAGAGAKVAKHGSYTNTRASGSANVLMALGVNIEVPPEVVSRCIAEAGVGFCFAVKCHPAMKHAVPVRKQLPVQTIFNILGPMTNPAGAKRQVMGIYEERLTEVIAAVLGRLGAIRAWVVHSEDGLDELSIFAATKVSEFYDGQVNTRMVYPEDFKLNEGGMDDLLVDSPEASAACIRGVLEGETGPARNIVLLNAAAALWVAGRVENLADGIAASEQAIDSGSAGRALEKLVAISNE